MAANGLSSLAIPQLARALGVTKGSFYWHFQSLHELIVASLRRWEENDRQALEETKSVRDPRARLAALFVQAMETRQPHALFVSLSGSSSPDVVSTLRRISGRRLRFLIQAYRQLGLAPSAARAQALLAYTAYVGALHLRQQESAGLSAERELVAYVRHAVKTLIPRRVRTDES
jgi:AcrR family transcriptional regulator